MDYHARHKIELLSRDEERSRNLGRLAAESRPETFHADRAAYATEYARAMAREPTTGTHANALQHLAGHVKDRASAQALALLVEAFREGHASLPAVKAALLQTLADEGATWASEQTYLAAR